MIDAREQFRKHFAHPPTHVLRAPGALELLGTGGFIADGLTLAAAVDRYVTIASAPRQDGRIEVIAPDTASSVKFWVDDLEGADESGAVAVFKSVLRELKRRGVHFTGFNAAVDPGPLDWPDLNREASLEAAVAFTVRTLHPYTLTETGVTTPPRPDPRGNVPAPKGAELSCIALACQSAAEQCHPRSHRREEADSSNRESSATPPPHVGGYTSRAGIESPQLADRLAILHGKAWNLTSLDSRNRSVEWLPLTGTALVLCRPADVAEKPTEPPHEHAQSCLDAAVRLGVKSLRTVEPASLKEKRSELGEREFSCAAHVLAELQRVVFAERALREGDLEQFGQYLLQSHDSAAELNLERDEKLLLLVDLARRTSGCLGARALLGRAATLNLVAHHAVPAFIKSLKRRFAHRTGTGVETRVCLPVNGVGRTGG